MAAMHQSWAAMAALKFLKPDKRGKPILNIILAIINCTSSGKVLKSGNKLTQSLRTISISLAKQSLTLSSETGVPTGCPYSGSLFNIKCPIPKVGSLR